MQSLFLSSYRVAHKVKPVHACWFTEIERSMNDRSSLPGLRNVIFKRPVNRSWYRPLYRDSILRVNCRCTVSLAQMAYRSVSLAAFLFLSLLQYSLPQGSTRALAQWQLTNASAPSCAAWDMEWCWSAPWWCSITTWSSPGPFITSSSQWPVSYHRCVIISLFLSFFFFFPLVLSQE